MAKSKKRAKRKAPKKATSSRKRRRHNTGSQTEQPFEQDAKRRIAQYGGTGEPPIMK